MGILDTFLNLFGTERGEANEDLVKGIMGGGVGPAELYEIVNNPTSTKAYKEIASRLMNELQERDPQGFQEAMEKYQERQENIQDVQSKTQGMKGMQAWDMVDKENSQKRQNDIEEFKQSNDGKMPEYYHPNQDAPAHNPTIESKKYPQPKIIVKGEENLQQNTKEGQVNDPLNPTIKPTYTDFTPNEGNQYDIPKITIEEKSTQGIDNNVIVGSPDVKMESGVDNPPSYEQLSNKMNDGNPPSYKEVMEESASKSSPDGNSKQENETQPKHNYLKRAENAEQAHIERIREVRGLEKEEPSIKIEDGNSNDLGKSEPTPAQNPKQQEKSVA